MNSRRVDETYAEEFEAARAEGLTAHLFSFESFETGTFRPNPMLPEGESVLYRGWMLREAEYSRLVQGIEACGAKAVTSLTNYRQCHHLPEWLPLLAHLTADTVVLPEGADYVSALNGLGWEGYFVKDFVKSLSTDRGSLVSSPSEISAVVDLLRKFRGSIEGGICIRRAQQFLPESERRFFVLNGKAHSVDESIPTVVLECADRMSSPFFSVDSATLTTGSTVVVELGDGQVSDRKEWSPAQFARLLASAS